MLSDQLGWKTYARQLQTVAAERDDFEPVYHLFTFPRLVRPWLRWANSASSKMARYKPVLFDPLQVAPIFLAPWWRAQRQDPALRAAHAASHVLGGVLKGTADRIPYTLALDYTRWGAQRDLAQSGWTHADFEREKRVILGAAGCFPMSGWVGGSLQKDAGYDADKIFVQPPSGQVASFVVAPVADRDKLRILFVGNDFMRKGGQRLVDWISGPLNGLYELHVVGANIGVPADHPDVTDYGRVPHEKILKEIYPAMDVFCLPTMLDMSPQVLMEAALSGLPCVASNIGGIPELIVHDQTGYVVEKTSDADFVAALKALAQDKGRRRAMGAAARAHALERMDAHRNFNALFDFMMSLGPAR